MLFGSPDTLLQRLVFFIPALFAGFILHELAHAVVANAQGDPTPKNQGRITLNPRRHIEPLGLVLVLLAGIGYAKPVVVNPSRLRGRYSMLLVAAAGPAANLAVAVVASLVLKIMVGTQPPVIGAGPFAAECSFTTGVFEVVKTELLFIYTLNLLLMVFNLLPVPPLDGFEVVRTFLREHNPGLLLQVQLNQQYILLGFLFVVFFLRDFLVSFLLFVLQPFIAVLGVPLGYPCV
ncbi:MAG: hypothetical protein QOE92_1785 [Chloroflexota bacterium]|jgi:Zn-dependent protease|nr:hypothetical protein [Chloroflexota bacterium]